MRVPIAVFVSESVASQQIQRSTTCSRLFKRESLSSVSSAPCGSSSRKASTSTQSSGASIKPSRMTDSYVPQACLVPSLCNSIVPPRRLIHSLFEIARIPNGRAGGVRLTDIIDHSHLVYIGADTMTEERKI